MLSRKRGVLLEDIDAKLDRVIEGHQALDRKIGKNHEEFQEFRQEVHFKFEAVFEEFHLIRSEVKDLKSEITIK